MSVKCGIILCMILSFALTTDSIFKKNDFKIENIDAFALAGGGFTAYTEHWSVLFMIAHLNKIETTSKLLQNKSVGSTGAGSLFMNALLYDQEIYKSFAELNGEKLPDAIGSKMKEIGEKMDSLLENSSFFSWVTVVKKACDEFGLKNMDGLSKVTTFICDRTTLEIVEAVTSLKDKNNVWPSLMEELGGSFNDSPNFENVHWNSLTAITTVLQYDQDQTLGLGKFYRSQFFDDTDDEEGIIQANDYYKKISGFPTFISLFNENTDVSVPRLEEDFKGGKTITLYDVVNDQSCWIFCSSKTSRKVETNIEEIKSEIKNSLQGNPKYYSGPSSAVIGSIGNYFMLDNMVKHITKGSVDIPDSPLKTMENYLYPTVWKTKKFGKSERDGIKVGLVGGALYDNSGIVATIRSLQQRQTKPSGRNQTIVAISATSMNMVQENFNLFQVDVAKISVDDFELQFLYEKSMCGIDFMPKQDKKRNLQFDWMVNKTASWAFDKGKKAVGKWGVTKLGNFLDKNEDLFQIQGFVDPAATIFKGQYSTPPQIAMFGKLQVLALTVESVENKDYGIKAGSHYDIILILPGCEISTDSLFPQSKNSKDYENCAKNVMIDMKRFFQSLKK